MTGWVKIHRALAMHDLWLAEPFTYGQAWVDLLIHTNHAPGSFVIKRQRVSLDRGQIGWSEITMTERWKWSRGKVRRFLKRLSSDGMIKQQTGHLTSVITICNYDHYQDKLTAYGTPGGTSCSTSGGTRNEHLTVHEAVHKQECKEEKEFKKEINTYGSSGDEPRQKAPAKANLASANPNEFEWIWANRPRREGADPKRKALQACNARIKQGATWREMAEGMKRYRAFCEAKGILDTEFVKQMATFFGPDAHFRNDWEVSAVQGSTSTHGGSRSGPDWDDLTWANDLGDL